ncbi:TIGR03750 family conjugal transfer protein [Serratia microhaemolytica]|uniref:TIGR03750 family conjugal transfer protein n=1 Tax=Serratia microhaemolytica TaxID=2675110 RepID=UPI000FDF0070|nr:TIGR03750 family conjugal transfer protein [Serratia microhaemolytica]
MQTIRFLPDRLNCEPMVFRGFTTPEMGLAALLGVGVGLLWSLPMAMLFGWVMIPSGMLVTPLLLIGFGGRWLSSMKRGKPENYIWQRLGVFKQHHNLGRRKGGSVLIIDARGWSLKRTGRI